MLSLFGRSLQLSPDAFFCAPHAELARAVRNMAQASMVRLSDSEVDILASGGKLATARFCIATWADLADLAAPADGARKRCHEQLHQEEIDAGKAGTHDVWICDYSQSTDRPRYGRRSLPALTCSSRYSSWLARRDMIAREHLVAQGIRGWHTPGLPFQLPWLRALQNEVVADRHVRILAGNGQNLCNIVPLQLFLLSHLEVLDKE